MRETFSRCLECRIDFCAGCVSEAQQNVLSKPASSPARVEPASSPSGRNAWEMSATKPPHAQQRQSQTEFNHPQVPADGALRGPHGEDSLRKSASPTEPSPQGHKSRASQQKGSKDHEGSESRSSRKSETKPLEQQKNQKELLQVDACKTSSASHMPGSLENPDSGLPPSPSNKGGPNFQVPLGKRFWYHDQAPAGKAKQRQRSASC